MHQRTIDRIARTFYLTLGCLGCIASVGLAALGVYGAISETILRNRLFFGVLAVGGVWVICQSVRLVRHVWTHDDLPEPDDL